MKETKAQIKQDDINKAIWVACDSFRGIVDPSIFMDYVLTMLILKYIPDVWQDQYGQYQKEHGDFNLNILRYVDTFEEEVEIDLLLVRKEREQSKTQLAELEIEMNRYMQKLGYDA